MKRSSPSSRAVFVVRGLQGLGVVVAIGAASVATFIHVTGPWSVWIAGIHVRVRDPLRAAVVALLALGIVLASRAIGHRRAGTEPSSNPHRGAAMAHVVGVALGGALATWMALLILSVIVNTFPESYPSGDGASLSLHTLDALRGLAYVGPYSQFGWNHPGPLLFYAMAPLYAVSGHHEMSLRVTALLINGGSLILLALVAQRAGARRLMLLSLVGITLMVWRAGGDLAFSPWNPHVTLLPFAALIVVSSAVAAGTIGLLPVTGVLASFLVQSHVGYAPVAVVLAFGSAIIAWRTVDVSRFRRMLNLTAWLVVILWILPLSEQLVARPGNMSLLWRYFSNPQGPGHSWIDVYELFATYYLLPFSVAIRLPLGWPAAVSHSMWPPIITSLLICATAAATVVLARRGDRFATALAGLSLASTIVALVSLSRIRGPLYDHQVVWVCVPGLLSVASVVSALTPWFPTRPDALRRVDSAVSWALVVAFLVIASARMVQWQQTAAQHREPLMAFEAIDRYVNMTNHTIVIKHTASSWQDVVGIVLQAAKRGRQVAVAPDLVRIVGHTYAPTGNEDNVYVVFDPAEDRDAAHDARHQQVLFANTRFAVAVIEP